MSLPTGPTDGRVDLNVVNLATLSNPVWAEYDYTNPALGARYQADIQVLFNVYNQGVTYSDPSATTPDPIPSNRLTQQDADNVAAALADLVNLAQNGAVLNNTPTSVKQYYLTTSMVTSLDILLRSFQAVGASSPEQGITLAQLNAWKDLSVESPVIQGAMTAALGQQEANTSIQALIELDYVKTGSDLINQKLTSLDQALTLTNGVLTTLGNIQTIHNDITVPGRATIPFNYNSQPTPSPGMTSGSAGDYRSQYTHAASIQFGAPLNPIVPSTLILYNVNGIPSAITAAGLSVFNSLLNLKQSLINEIAQVSAQSSPSDLSDPNSLYNKLKIVKNDLSTLFSVVNPSDPTGPRIPASVGLGGAQKASALFNWIIDNYNQQSGTSSTNAGLTQQNITLAITAAQSLNDTQKENVRNFLFVFQEYYQSAAAILQAINQIITKMAQGISQ